MTALTDATFYLPNTTTSVLTNGSGSVTNSRATTKNIFDNEGKLITVKSGGTTRGGARCVQNLLAATATLSTQGVTVTARTYTISFYGTGTIAFTGAHAGSSLVGTGVSDRVQKTFTCTAGTLTCTVTGSCTSGQLEDVTGQADQTASEYVSVGVLSAPYHGGGADGIKYFATNKDGSAIPDANLLGAHIDPASKTNSLLHCRTVGASTTNDPASSSKWISSTTGSDIVTNGAFGTDTSDWTGSGITLSLDTNRLKAVATVAGNSAYWYIPMTTVIGVRYVVSFDYSVDAVTGGLYLSARNSPAASTVALYSVGNTTGQHTFAFTATATATYLAFSNASSALIGEYSIIDNVTCYPAGIDSTLTGTGIDGLANSCSRLTFKAAGATILQTITAAATAACSGFWVKRVTGTGTIEFTRDNVTWLDITSELSTDDFYIAKIENTSVTNPVIGFRGGTVDDVIDVDAGLNHSGTQLTLPIFTTTAAVTRNADVITYQTSGNFSDTAGTILATFKPTYDTPVSGSIVGKASFGLLASTANSGAQAADGTNTVSGAAGTPTGQIKIGARWSGSSLQAFYETNYGVAGSYDGAFNLTTIGLNTGAAGYIRDIAIFDSSLADGSIGSAWGMVTPVPVTGVYGTLSVGTAIVAAGASIHPTGIYANAYVTSGTPGITAAASVAPTTTEMYSHLGSVEVTEYWPDLSGGGGGGTGKFTRGTCDRCGFVYKLNVLKVLVINQSPSGLMVCAECWEEDHPQNRIDSLRLKESNPIRNPRPDTPSGDD